MKDIIALAKAHKVNKEFATKFAVALEAEIRKESEAEIAELQQVMIAAAEEKREASENMLRLIADVRYVAGIAERGRGKPLEDGEKFTQVVLDYVKSLEAQNAKLMEALEKAEKDVERLDYLEREASCNFSYETCEIGFEVGEDFEGANSIREIVDAALTQKEGKE